MFSKAYDLQKVEVVSYKNTIQIYEERAKKNYYDRAKRAKLYSINKF